MAKLLIVSKYHQKDTQAILLCGQSHCFHGLTLRRNGSKKTSQQYSTVISTVILDFIPLLCQLSLFQATVSGFSASYPVALQLHPIAQEVNAPSLWNCSPPPPLAVFPKHWNCSPLSGSVPQALEMLL